MSIKANRALFAFCAAATLCAVVLIGYLYPEPVELTDRWIRDYPRVAPFVFIGAKMVTVLVPPVPSAALGLAGIHFFGWHRALLYDYVGNMGASVAAFFIARNFRPALMRRFAFVQGINKWAEERLPGRLGFRTFLLIRIFTEGIFDFLSYAAGLTRIKFSTYFFATALGCIPMKFLMFYLGGVAFRTSQYVTAAFVLLLIVGAVWLQKSGAYERVIDKTITTRGDG